MSLLDLNWFAVRVPPNREGAAENQIKRDGHRTLMPREYRWRRYGKGGRRREVSYPIFPGYVFVGFDTTTPNWHRLKTNCDLVINPIGFGGVPAQFTRSDAIFLLRLDRGDADIPELANKRRSLKSGDKAEIAAGHPFAGHTVTVDSIVAKKARVFLSVLSGMQTVTISLDRLEPA